MSSEKRFVHGKPDPDLDDDLEIDLDDSDTDEAERESLEDDAADDDPDTEGSER